MANLDLLIKALDTAIWELSEAFQGMPDEDVWKRPHPKLLSVGELAAHIAFWEAISFLGEGFESPLPSFPSRYYSANVDEPLDSNLTADEVFSEVKRTHEACKTAWNLAPHDSEEMNPNREGWTWRQTVEYQAFHVAYHTGQIYSVRHLLGHATVDN